MDSSELTKNKRNRVTANSLSGGGIARPHSNITMNTQVLSSYRLGSRLVSHNKHLVLPFCQPPLCDTDLGSETEPEPPVPPIAQGWATNIGNIDENEGEFGFNATDSDGNIYVVGRFNLAPSGPGGDPMELYDFDFLNPSQIVQTTIGDTLTSDPPAGVYNIYLAKYDPLGAVIWATKILLENTDTTIQIVASDITVDSNNDVYVSISGTAAVPLGPNPTEVEFFNSDGTSYGRLAVPVQLTVVPPLSTREKYGILVKYDSNGVCQWVTKQDNIDSVSGIYQGTDSHSVSISGTNDVILSGRFGAATANPVLPITGPYQLYLYEAAPPVGGIITPSLYGYLDSSIINSGFVVKYDTNGLITWATKVEMNNVPPQSNPQVPTRLTSNTTSGTDIYLLLNMFTASPIITYYNTDTVTPFPPGGLIPVGDSYILDKSGIPFPTGVFGRSMYIAKYDVDGLFQWSNLIKANPFGGTAVEGFDIKCDQNNGVYVTGTFSDRIQLDSFQNITGSLPGPFTINTIPFAELSTSGSSGGSTGFLLKYNTSGIAQWATQLWTPVFSNTESKAIAIDTNNKVTITGLYNNSALTIDSFLNATGPVIPPTLLTPSINTTPYGVLAYTPPVSFLSKIFVVQYDDNGIVQWATSIEHSPSVGNPQVYGISTDPNDDSINITGFQSVQLAFNDYLTGVGPGGGSITTSLWGKLPALGSGDAFIVKYKSNGKVGL
jgi:hypothetical protein